MVGRDARSTNFLVGRDGEGVPSFTISTAGTPRMSRGKFANVVFAENISAVMLDFQYERLRLPRRTGGVHLLPPENLTLGRRQAYAATRRSQLTMFDGLVVEHWVGKSSGRHLLTRTSEVR